MIVVLALAAVAGVVYPLLFRDSDRVSSATEGTEPRSRITQSRTQPNIEAASETATGPTVAVSPTSTLIPTDEAPRSVAYQAQLHLERGNKLADQEQRDAAIAEYDKAIELDPNYVQL